MLYRAQNRHRSPRETVLLVLICGLVLGFAGCGGETITGLQKPDVGNDTPEEPQNPPLVVDLTPLVNFLRDPLVRSIPTLLKEQPAAEPLHAALLALLRDAEAGNVEGVKVSFESTRVALQGYRNRPGIQIADTAVVAAEDLVLLQAEALFYSLIRQAGIPQIKLL